MIIVNENAKDQQAGLEIILASRPVGRPNVENFTLVPSHLRDLADGEVLVRNLFMSVDPYMRGRMNDAASYVSPFTLHGAIDGAAVGEVIASRADGFSIGDMVFSMHGWREKFIAMPGELRRISREVPSLSVYLGALGMTGMTAWAGLKLAHLKAGETIYVSAAAGAVGTVVGQLAKIYGGRVIGSAGSAKKVEFLRRECHFDDAFNYHDGLISDQLKRIAPKGIDVYFDNVGGETLEAAITALNVHGRIIACGGISRYNDEIAQPGPNNLMQMVSKRLTMTGLLVGDWQDRRPEFEAEMGGYLRDGRVKNHETVVNGIGQAVSAFLGLFAGENTGKMVVRLD